MSPGPALYSTILQMLVKYTPRHVLSKDISQIIQTKNFPNGQISPGNSLLDPQLPDIQVPYFPSTPPRADALGGY